MSEAITPIGAVIYTDGSARPNPGFYGSGLHGYSYVYPTEKQKPTKAGVWQITDQGYMLQKDMDASEAKPVVVINYLDSFEGSEYEGTNNLAEINALSLFFEHYPEVVSVIEKLHVLADSQYMLNGIKQWVAGWMRNNWLTGKGTPVNNREAWERAYGYVNDFQKRGQVELVWVRGHNDEFGNVKADYLAGIATNHSTAGMATKYIKLSEPNGYHKSDVKLHPLLGLKRVYFNTDSEINTQGTYYQTGWSGNDQIDGKRSPEASFSVIQLETPDPIIEEVMQAQYRAPADFNNIVFIKLDRLRSADVYPYIEEHGRFCLNVDQRNLNMNFLDRKPVTMEVRAGELPMRAIEVLNHLEEILSWFKNSYLGTSQDERAPVQYSVHDITDHFYDKGMKKVGKTEVPILTLKKHFGVGIKSTEIQVDEVVRGEEKTLKLPLVFMDDMPSRNIFKNLETLSPRVFLITWRESERLYRYSTVIQTTDAIGIWSNYFANQLLL